MGGTSPNSSTSQREVRILVCRIPTFPAFRDLTEEEGKGDNQICKHNKFISAMKNIGLL